MGAFVLPLICTIFALAKLCEVARGWRRGALIVVIAMLGIVLLGFIVIVAEAELW